MNEESEPLSKAWRKGTWCYSEEYGRPVFITGESYSELHKKKMAYVGLVVVSPFSDVPHEEWYGAVDVNIPKQGYTASTNFKVVSRLVSWDSLRPLQK